MFVTVDSWTRFRRTRLAQVLVIISTVEKCHPDSIHHICVIHLGLYRQGHAAAAKIVNNSHRAMSIR